WGGRLFAGEYQALARLGGVCAAPCRTAPWGGFAPGRGAGPATDVSVVWTADRAAWRARWRFLRDRFSPRGCAHWQSAIRTPLVAERCGCPAGDCRTSAGCADLLAPHRPGVLLCHLWGPLPQAGRTSGAHRLG